MAKKNPLLQAFDDLPDRPAPAPAVIAARPQKARAAATAKAGNWRDGRKSVTFWLPEEYDMMLSELEHKLKRAGQKKTRVELGEEALRDLFKKHGLPAVGE